MSNLKEGAANVSTAGTKKKMKPPTFLYHRSLRMFLSNNSKSWKHDITWAAHLDKSETKRVKVIQRSSDKERWKESEYRGPRCCSYRLVYSSGPFYSNSSPLKIRCSELFWWLLWAKCVLLQVLHEIARVRWRGLWRFWVNTSSELFGGWELRSD